MEKRRIRLEINGVVCGLITRESDEYMNGLAQEVGDAMRQIQEASPYITREAAALTAALSYCDDAKKNGDRAAALQERVDELEVEAELWQEEKAEMEKTREKAPGPRAEDPALLERLQKLEDENAALREEALERAQAAGAAAPEQGPEAAPRPRRGKNPLRYEDGLEQEGMVSFFEKG